MPRMDASATPAADVPPPASEDDHVTAGKWAAQQRSFFASRVDVLKGYSKRFDPYEIVISLSVCALGAYAVYLMYCESCKDEYWELLRSIQSAVADALTGTKGSAPAEAAVLGVMVWLLTVLWMRQRAKVYLVEFKTYRHAAQGGPAANTQAEQTIEIEQCPPQGLWLPF